MKLHLPLTLLAFALLSLSAPVQAAFTDANGVRTYTGSDNTNMLSSALPEGNTGIIFATPVPASGTTNWFTGTVSYGGTVTIGGETAGTGLHINNGGTGTVEFSGAVDGSGELRKSGNGENMHLLLSGDATAYSGNITLNANSGRTFHLDFGGQVSNSTGSTADGRVGVSVPVACSEKAGVSGTGVITFNSSANYLTYKYNKADADDTSVAWVTNEIVRGSSSVTSRVNIAGSADMVFTKNVQISALNIVDNAVDAAHITFREGSIGTVTGTAARLYKAGDGSLAVSNLGANVLEVQGGTMTGTLTQGTLSFNGGGLSNFTLNGGTLDFGTLSSSVPAGATVSGSLALTSGDIVFEVPENHEGMTTYTLLSAAGLGAVSVDYSQMTFNGQHADETGTFICTSNFRDYQGSLGLSTSEGMTLSLQLLRGAALTWNGSEASHTWSNQSESDWLVGDEASGFLNADDVTFSGGGYGTVTLEGSLMPGSVTVERGNYTFEGSGHLAGDASIGLGNGVEEAQLTLSTNNTVWQGSVEVQNQATLTASAAQALGAAVVNVNDGGTLIVNHAEALGEATVSINSGAVAELGAANALSAGTITLNGGLFRYGLGTNADVSAHLNVVDGADLAVDLNGNTVTWAHNAFAGKALVVQDASASASGSLTLSDNSASGPASLRIEGGTVVLLNGRSLATSSNLISTDVTMTGGRLLITGQGSGNGLYFQSANTSVYTYLFDSGLNLAPVSGAEIEIAAAEGCNRGIGFFPADGGGSINVLTYDGSQGGGTATISADISSFGTSKSTTRVFDISDSSGTEVEVHITGSVGEKDASKWGDFRTTLLKKGTGTLRLSGANHTPYLTVEEGVVMADHEQALGVSRALGEQTSTQTLSVGTSATSASATLDMVQDGSTAILQGSDKGRITSSTGATLTVGAEDGATSSSFAGSIEGNVSLRLRAQAHLELTGCNSSTGTTTLEQGASLVFGDATLTAWGESPATMSGVSYDRAGIMASGEASLANLSLEQCYVLVADASTTLSMKGVNFGTSCTIDNEMGGTVTLSGVNSLTLGAADLVAASAAQGVVALAAEIATDALDEAVAAPEAITVSRLNGVEMAEGASLAIDMSELGLSGEVDVFFAGLSGAATANQFTLVGYEGYTVSMEAQEGGTLLHIQAVPEPATASLSLLALAALAARRRRS